MNFFDYDNYDYDYQRYQDWKINQEEEDRYYEGCDLADEYEYDLQRERELDERRASQYVAEKEETTGERAVREAQEEEEDVRQLAQVSVGGVFRYDMHWLPETHEVRVEVDQFPDGSPMYLWYPDNMVTMHVLSKLLNIPEDQIRITGLTFFTKDDMLVAFKFEERQFLNNTWRDYAADGNVMQFNVEIACPNACYDAACDGTNCEFKPVRPHGIDGTQCDCSDCTLDYGYCSCGCGGDFQKHGEWLEEREKQRQAFVHETAEPLGGTLAEYMKDYMDEPEPDSPKPTLEIEKDDDNESETSVESAEEKESRLWSDFKLAMMSALMALMLGTYICRSLIC
jgi:hypothetical protein